MSQAGVLNVISSNPSIPILFDGNTGSATAIFNTLNIIGSLTQGVSTSGDGFSTLTITVADATTNSKGVAEFDPADFTVVAGVVSLLVDHVETITGNSGGALSPVGGNWNIIGNGSTVTSGAVSTLTVSLTGLTTHAVLVGAGTATINKVGPTATAGQVLQSAGLFLAPAFSTATYPLTTTVSQILFSSATNTVTELATANRAVLTTGTTGVPVLTALASNGQLIIGSTAGSPAAATLTAGAGVTITNASNAITITASTFLVGTWTDVTGATQTLAIGNGYATDRGAGVTYTLPATATAGDIMQVTGKLGITTISQNAGQQILIGSGSSTAGVGGSVVATNVGDTITLRCITGGASTIWRSESVTGNWTIN